MSRLGAAARTAPVVALLLLHGVAVGRLAVAGVAVVVLLVGRVAGLRPPMGRAGEVALGVAGAAVGGLALLVSETPPGPLPPVVLSPLCGALAALSVGYSLVDNTTRAWSAAMLLVVAATSSPPLQPLAVPGALTVAVLLASLFVLAHGRALSMVRAGAFAVLVGLTLAGGAGLLRVMTASEGVLLPLFEALLASDAFGSGLGLQSMVPLTPYSTATLSDRVILEIDGDAPAYFRGQVMDEFDGDLWTASEAIQAGAAAPWQSPGAEELTLTVFTGVRDILPVPAGVRTRDGAVPSLTAGWLVQGEALRGDEIVLTRDAAVALPTEPPPAARPLPDELAEALRPIAAEIVGEAQTAGAMAAAIEAHLQTQHTYSLTSDLRGDGHPLVVLLTEKKPAYCVYFASAMAAMLRSLSVDARLVGGFVAAERSPLTGRTLIRKRDAHAWVEVYLPETGRWTPFDPTPSRDAVLDVQTPGLGRAIQDFLVRLAVRIRSHPDEVLRQVLLSPPVLVLLVAGVGWAVRQRLRGGPGWRRRRRGVAQTDPALWPLYRRYLKVLARVKIVPDPAESDAEILDRVAAQAPALHEAAAAFITAYRAARYRGGSAEEAESALRGLERR